VVVHALITEPVSARNSLHTGVLQGIFAPQRELPFFPREVPTGVPDTCALSSLLVRAGKIRPGAGKRRRLKDTLSITLEQGA
jgi:hypothetical protein